MLSGISQRLGLTQIGFNRSLILFALGCILILVLWLMPLEKQTSAEQTTSPSYPHQLAMGDCAPWDGPAIRIYLAQKPLIPNKQGYFQPNSPFINMGIWTEQPALNQWLSFQAYQDKLGSVAVCNTYNDCQPAEGEIRFTEFSSQRIVGTLRLKGTRSPKSVPYFKPQIIPVQAQYFLPKRPVLCG